MRDLAKRRFGHAIAIKICPMGIRTQVSFAIRFNFSFTRNGILRETYE